MEPFSLVASTPHLQEALTSIHNASSEFSSPDPTVRARGEATFLALRMSEGSVEYACFALEHSSDPFVLFQAYNLILSALPSLSQTQPRPSIPSLSTLLDFLVRIAIYRGEKAERETVPGQQARGNGRNAGPWPTYVRSRAYQVIAAVAKRVCGLAMSSALASSGPQQAHDAARQHMESLGNQLASLLAVPQVWPTESVEAAVAAALVTAGLGIAGALVDEMGLSSGSGSLDTEAGAARGKKAGKQRAVEPGSAVGLTALEHRWCKAAMQAHLLPTLMTLVFHLLYNCLPAGAHPAASGALFAPVVALFERLLGWHFLVQDPFAGLSGNNVDVGALILADGADEDTSDASDDNRRIFVARQVPAEFQGLLLSTDLINLIAAAYQHALPLETSSELSDRLYSSVAIHRLRQCLVLAASYTPAPGVHFAPEAQLARTAAFVATLESLVTEECSTIVSSSRLATSRAKALLFLALVFNVFLSSTAPATLCAACHVSASDVGRLTNFVGALAQLGNAIFAFAFRRAGDSDEEEELVSLAEECNDTLLGCWSTFCSSVQSTIEQGDSSDELRVLWHALVGTLRPSVVVPYIEGRLAAAGAESADDTSEVGEESGKDRDLYGDQLITLAMLARYDVRENLRHLLSLAAPLCAALASVAEGRVNVRDEHAQKELEVKWEQVHWLALISGHVLADSVQGETPAIPSSIAALTDSAEDHPALQLITLLGLTLLHQLTSSPAHLPASPLVTEQLLWFNSRWSASYLLTLSGESGSASPALSTAFGSSGGGEQVLGFLLKLLRENIERWLSDADVLQQVASVLTAIMRSEGVKSCLLKRPEFEPVVAAVIHGLDALPASTHGALITAVVSCIYGSASGDGQRAAAYFHQITSAVEERLGAVLLRPDFAAISQQGTVMAKVLTVLDMLEGLAASTQPSSAEAIYSFVSRFFEPLIGLIAAYKTRAEVPASVLRVMLTLANSLDLGFCDSSHLITGVNAAVWHLLHALAAAPEALVPSDTSSVLEEDTPFEGLCLALELISTLCSSSNDEDAASSWLDGELRPERASDVALFGFSCLVPLLSTDPLSVPRIRRELGLLTGNVVRSFPHRLFGLGIVGADGAGARLLESTIRALDLSIAADDAEVALMALEGVVPLASAVTAVTRQASRDPQLLLGAVDHLLSSILRSLLLEALEPSLLDAHLLALRALLLARMSEYSGGQAGLSSALTHLQQNMSLVPQRRALSSEMSPATDSNDTGRREALAAAVGELAHAAALSAPPTNLDSTAHLTPLQARAQAKENKERGTRFCAASRSVTLTARAALRVR